MYNYSPVFMFLPAAQPVPAVVPPLAILLSENTVRKKKKKVLVLCLWSSFMKSVIRGELVEKETVQLPLKIIGFSGSDPGSGLGSGAGGRFWMIEL